jgi:transglutaminase-like putative cysteine protease
MTWRLRVRHRTGYSYDGPVVASYNEVRMTPLTDLHQTTVSAEIVTDPRTVLHRYWDYWGTLVTAFDVHDPHDRLTITSTAVVETEAAESPPEDIGWSKLQDPAVADEYGELLDATRYVPADPELHEQAQSLATGLSPNETVHAVCAWVHGALEYEPGVTGVHTSGPEALHAGRGVCQDYAHLALVLLRGLGIPARYVSGYLHPVAEAERGATVKGESHAWIEAWTGLWWGHDPTNDVALGERHVTVARGRDYADVSPLRGIYSGGSSSALGVEVEVTRLR